MERRIGVDDVPRRRIRGPFILIPGEGEVGVGDTLEEAPKHRLGDTHARARVVAGAGQHAHVRVARGLSLGELDADFGGPHHGRRGIEKDEDVGLRRAFAEEVAVIG